MNDESVRVIFESSLSGIEEALFQLSVIEQQLNKGNKKFEFNKEETIHIGNVKLLRSKILAPPPQPAPLPAAQKTHAQAKKTQDGPADTLAAAKTGRKADRRSSSSRSSSSSQSSSRSRSDSSSGRAKRQPAKHRRPDKPVPGKKPAEAAKSRQPAKRAVRSKRSRSRTGSKSPKKGQRKETRARPRRDRSSRSSRSSSSGSSSSGSSSSSSSASSSPKKEKRYTSDKLKPLSAKAKENLKEKLLASMYGGNSQSGRQKEEKVYSERLDEGAETIKLGSAAH